MLSRIDIQALKVIRELSVELDQFTVLVGPNACGKSSVLRAIEYLCRMRDTAPREIFVDRDALDEIKTRGVDGPFVLGGRTVDTDVRWIVTSTEDADPVPDNESPLESAKLQVSGARHGEWTDVMDGDRIAVDVWSQPLRDMFRKAIPRIPTAVALHFEFDRLAEPTEMPEGEPRVAPNGSDLAPVLAYLALEHRTHFEHIKQAMVEIIPVLRDIRVRNQRVPRRPEKFRRGSIPKDDEWRRRRRDPFDDDEIYVPGFALEFDIRSGATGLPAHAMSDGTLRLLGLLTVALAPEPPQLLLLDNIEYGLHPRALHDVVGLLRRAQESDPELQIVAATHSADLLDYVEPEQIRLLWPGDDGYTRCVRMTEHPSFDEWKALMTPSEMWAEFDREQQPPRAEDE